VLVYFNVSVDNVIINLYSGIGCFLYVHYMYNATCINLFLSMDGGFHRVCAVVNVIVIPFILVHVVMEKCLLVNNCNNSNYL